MRSFLYYTLLFFSLPWMFFSGLISFMALNDNWEGYKEGFFVVRDIQHFLSSPNDSRRKEYARYKGEINNGWGTTQPNVSLPSLNGGMTLRTALKLANSTCPEAFSGTSNVQEHSWLGTKIRELLVHDIGRKIKVVYKPRKSGKGAKYVRMMTMEEVIKRRDGYKYDLLIYLSSTFAPFFIMLSICYIYSYPKNIIAEFKKVWFNQ